MKILITGAHFTPAVAVSEELKKYPDVNIVYVGRSSTMEGDSSKSQESQILPKLGVRFISITSGRLQRSFTIYTIPSLLKIPIGFIQAFSIILTEKPDVILSFGGYVAVPIVFIGWLFSIPIIIHEQTLVTGLANKVSSFFADKIALSFKNNTVDERVITTGNPIRHKILEGARLGHLRGGLDRHPTLMLNKPLILITGGNQGSHMINKTVEECLDKLTKFSSLIHVTGNQLGDFERLERLQNEYYTVKKWIDEEWGEVLSKVDLVISRAGINTLTELAYLGKPGLVIPIPYLYQDEQNKNARYFEEHGLVRILPQSKLSGKTLVGNVRFMLNNLQSLKQKAKMARKVVIPDAAKRLALETILLAR